MGRKARQDNRPINDNIGLTTSSNENKIARLLGTSQQPTWVGPFGADRTSELTELPHPDNLPSSVDELESMLRINSPIADEVKDYQKFRDTSLKESFYNPTMNNITAIREEYLRLYDAEGPDAANKFFEDVQQFHSTSNRQQYFPEEVDKNQQELLRLSGYPQGTYGTVKTVNFSKDRHGVPIAEESFHSLHKDEKGNISTIFPEITVQATRPETMTDGDMKKIEQLDYLQQLMSTIANQNLEIDPVSGSATPKRPTMEEAGLSFIERDIDNYIYRDNRSGYGGTSGPYVQRHGMPYNLEFDK